jgi:hypothetical protein
MYVDRYRWPVRLHRIAGFLEAHRAQWGKCRPGRTDTNIKWKHKTLVFSLVPRTVTGGILYSVSSDQSLAPSSLPNTQKSDLSVVSCSDTCRWAYMYVVL